MKVWMVTLASRDEVADASTRELMELVLDGSPVCATLERAKHLGEQQMLTAMDADDDGADALIVTPDWEVTDGVHHMTAWDGALVCHVWEVEVVE